MTLDIMINRMDFPANIEHPVWS